MHPVDPDPVSDITVVIDETLTSYNATSRVLTISTTISWQPPTYLYGVFQDYSVLVQSSDGADTVHQTTVQAESVMAVLEVMAGSAYTVTVTVTTGGGTSTTNTSFTSPEASKGLKLLIALSYIGIYFAGSTVCL